MASADVIAQLSNVQTNGQARAVLGVVTTAILPAGYNMLPQVSTDQGVRAAAQALLDTANTYAGQIYASIPADDASQQNPVDFLVAARLGLCVSQAEDAVDNVADAANVSRFDFGTALGNAIAETAAPISAGVTDAAQKIGAAATASFMALMQGAWPWVALGVGVIVVYKFRKPILEVLK